MAEWFRMNWDGDRYSIYIGLFTLCSLRWSYRFWEILVIETVSTWAMLRIRSVTSFSCLVIKRTQLSLVFFFYCSTLFSQHLWVIFRDSNSHSGKIGYSPILCVIWIEQSSSLSYHCTIEFGFGSMKRWRWRDWDDDDMVRQCDGDGAMTMVR